MAKSKGNNRLSTNTFRIFRIGGYVSFLLLMIFDYFLYQLDVLPSKYLFLLLIVTLLVELFAIGAILFFKKPLKIAGFVVVIIFGLFSGIGIYYGYHANSFLNDSFRNSKLNSSATYYIIVPNDSNISSINDIDSTFSYLSGTYLIDQALTSFQEKKNIQMTSYDDALTMFQDLKSHLILGALVDQTSYQLILEMKNEFVESDFKVIDSFEVQMEVENDPISNSSDKFQVYIGGNDFTNSLMDFNMIVTINTKSHRILFTSIPRDYYIPVFGYDGRRDTLSFMGARGIEVNRRSLADFLGMDLNYFMKLETKSLVGIVDQVGGITYCSDRSFTTTHATILDTYDDSKGNKLDVKKGCQKLNGIEALTVARERLAFPGGDRQRQKNCQQIIMAIFKQLISTNTITNYNNILSSLSDLYQTNIPREIITDLIKETIAGAEWDIENQSMDGSDSNNFVHLSNLRSYVMIPNPDSVEEAKIKMKDILDS